MATAEKTTPKPASRTRARSTKREETTARRTAKTEATAVKPEPAERTRRHRSTSARRDLDISFEATDQVLEQLPHRHVVARGGQIPLIGGDRRHHAAGGAHCARERGAGVVRRRLAGLGLGGVVVDILCAHGAILRQ